MTILIFISTLLTSFGGRAYSLFLLLWLAKQTPPRPLVARLGMLLLFPLVLPAAYFSLYDAPRFMRCIYSQQYQMARLVPAPHPAAMDSGWHSHLRPLR